MNEWRIGRAVLIDSANHSGWLPRGAAEPHPTQARYVNVWIAFERDAYYLFTADGEHVFDSWHRTLEDAIVQAQFSYGVAPEEWRATAAPSN
jgi:hypothetical protein